MDPIVSTALAVAFLVSAVSGAVILATRSLIEPFLRQRDDGTAIQASHDGNPLRLGGVGAMFGLLLGAWMLSGHSCGVFASALLVSTVPVLLAGLSEDIGRHVTPLGRFAAAGVSALIALLLLNIWVPRGDLAFVDALMVNTPIAMLLTLVFAAGFCHAMNLIDGMNGLAGITIVLSALGLAVISAQEGLVQISVLAGLLAAGTAGFLAFNWPHCRLLLGDAGAYGLGHVLVWLAISVAALSPAVAVPALMLVLFWPIADVVHTVLRRLLTDRSLFAPDRMHLHQILRRALEIVALGRRARYRSNPLSTLILTPFICAPVVAGVLLAHQPALAWMVLALFGLAFAAAHVLVTRLARLKRSERQRSAGAVLPEIASASGLHRP